MQGINWTPSAKMLAQQTHFLGAAIIMLLSDRIHGTPWHYALGIVVCAALKEFWVDRTWLEHDSLVGSTWDFIFYVFGGGCGWLALLSVFHAVLLAIPIMIGLTIWDILRQKMDKPESLMDE